MKGARGDTGESDRGGFLNASEAAAFLGVRPDTIVRAIDRGRLPAIRLGRVYKIARADLQPYTTLLRGQGIQEDDREKDVELLAVEIETLLTDVAISDPFHRPKVVAALQKARLLRARLALAALATA